MCFATAVHVEPLLSLVSLVSKQLNGVRNAHYADRLTEAAWLYCLRVEGWPVREQRPEDVSDNLGFLSLLLLPWSSVVA